MLTITIAYSAAVPVAALDGSHASEICPGHNKEFNRKYENNNDNLHHNFCGRGGQLQPGCTAEIFELERAG